jgi:murein DD-endopeptidase MepM/ murein hydrolase activator NlpD
VTFSWNTGVGANQYVLYVGTAFDTYNLYDQNVGTNLSVTVTGLPTNGSTIYVRLWSDLPSGWQFNDYTYTAAKTGGFLTFPLHGCADSACTINYTTHGAYTAGAMNSVLDHSMALDPKTQYYPYGTTQISSSGGDQKIEAFNGEIAKGTRLASDFRCIGGTINLHPDWNPSVRMTNDSGCGSNYSSYDEHPGYDYHAGPGIPVYAAAKGIIISTICYLGNIGGGNCGDWGALAIDHGNGYFSQYLHMATYTVNLSPGQSISAGQQIGTVGNKCYMCSVPYHLHFEVRHIGPSIGPEPYPIVDPYGWAGGADPLYSVAYIAPRNLWQ